MFEDAALPRGGQSQQQQQQQQGSLLRWKDELGAPLTHDQPLPSNLPRLIPYPLPLPTTYHRGTGQGLGVRGCMAPSHLHVKGWAAGMPGGSLKRGQLWGNTGHWLGGWLLK